MIYRLLCFYIVHKIFNIYQNIDAKFGGLAKTERKTPPNLG